MCLKYRNTISICISLQILVIFEILGRGSPESGSPNLRNTVPLKYTDKNWASDLKEQLGPVRNILVQYSVKEKQKPVFYR